MESYVVFLLFVVCLLDCHGWATNVESKPEKEGPEPGSARKRCHFHYTSPMIPGRVDTHSRLRKLRYEMVRQTSIESSIPLDAYIVTSDDEHQSEFVADHDKRREYISGFSGSFGDVIITNDKAALWTDGRYHIQADVQLSCEWLLMKQGQSDVPTRAEWLKKNLYEGAKVGADPKLMPNSVWEALKADLENSSIHFVEVRKNLIDIIWDSDQPLAPADPVYPLQRLYAGVPWKTKVENLRKEISQSGADAMVVTALDEIAWLLNIRGSDIPFNPFVRSYAIVTMKDVFWYVDPNKVDDKVKLHLKTDVCISDQCVRINDYDAVWLDLRTMSQVWNSVIVPSAVIYKPGASRAIYRSIPQAKILPKESPIVYMKARKNPTEIKGMENAHIRDAAAMCIFLEYFERRVLKARKQLCTSTFWGAFNNIKPEDNIAESKFQEGYNWNELNTATVLDQYRYGQNLSKGLSFPSIVGYGPHGASPHYEPSESTNIPIKTDSTLVIDSGGQYLDGTTDVTRTLHLGEPTAEQKEAYTRVLIGSIQLSQLIFPANLLISQADVVARAPLWEVGLDFLHGTGHGVGAFLGVHESPIAVSISSRQKENFKEGYFFSNEPGYYKEGDFGIRLENVLEVIKEDKSHPTGIPFLKFKDVTLVPYEPKLIDYTLLTANHRRWLNVYNNRIRELVGAELRRQRKTDAFNWMVNKTKHIPVYGNVSSAPPTSHFKKTVFAFLISAIVLIFNAN